MNSKLVKIISEYKRLTALPEPELTEFANLVISEEVKINNGVITSTALASTLAANGVPAEFFQTDSKTVDRNLYQYLFLHFLIMRDAPLLNTLEEIYAYVNSIALRAALENRHEKSAIVIVLEHLNKTTWGSVGKTMETNPQGVYLLEGSLPFCEIDLETLYAFLDKLGKVQPERKTYRFWGRHIVEKLKENPAMRSGVLQDLSVFYADPVLHELFPAFLSGAINGDPKLFTVQLEKTTAQVSDANLANTLYAFASACPGDEASITLLRRSLDDNLHKGRLSPAAYLQVLNLINITTPDVTSYVLERTLIADINELGFITDYLNQQLASAGEEWFKKILAQVVVMPQPELIGNLNHLLTMLMDDHKEAVYEALDHRFAAIGAKSFLSEIWQELPEQEPALFSKWLTIWFGRDKKTIHQAMLQLTSGRDIPHMHFVLSAAILTPLTEIEKLFIAYKIAGYVYDRHALQALFFSLIEHMKADEEALRDQLYIIMNDYVLYNYRSTFDMIKTRLKEESLPPYVAEFYERIIFTYEQYFKELDTIAVSVELRPDPVLQEHVHYFWQYKMTSGLKEKRKTGLASLFKNTTLNSHRWAIRGRGDVNLQPQTLSTIRAEFEFPAGEVLNPLQSEHIRSTFQKVTKDEITLN